MDKEEEGKGKKKKKKDKKKKGKGKAEEGDKEGGDDSGEEGEGGDDGKKKKKKAKVKKPKAEKKPLELDIETGKPLSKRNVKLIFILAASLLVGIYLLVVLLPSLMVNTSARNAYKAGDYETAYRIFYGDKKLSKNDELIYKKSVLILKLSHKYQSFSSYRGMGRDVEALDQLLQAVSDYETLLISAESYGVVSEFNEEFTKITDALSICYGLSLEEAKEINSLPTDLEYSLKVESIVNGTDYIDPTKPLPGPFVPSASTDEPVYEDMLSEEE